ncbi:hypothetical protein [Allonocardiopsis opalescens]|uniref:Uncharacterized protein n=1 Tax=Allonocardiopsis opalescens TaxID=1144618 RepID=A0A2T0PTA2_9ACTN|nr:hypothetical protein [Allonocardiopsis opalescens]PRX91946.1 hypothetical protein CLV72_11219 [Allonocardiopsis opalescens]
MFRLVDIDIRWSGRDSNTPDGCIIATGLDPHGNLRTFLYRGDEPSDGGFLGSILYPEPGAGTPLAYGPRGGWVPCGGGEAAMLVRLAEKADREGQDR